MEPVDTSLDIVSTLPVLMHYAQKMATSHVGILNLVRPDWKTVLYNHPTFQRFQTPPPPFHPVQDLDTISLQKVMLPHVLNVIVLGKFTLYSEKKKDYAVFVSQQCEPLTEISKTMTQDCKEYELVDQSRFIIEYCNPLFCHWCRREREKLKMGLISKRKEWCILTTRVFDGEKIKNTFKESIEENFRGQTFHGILHLQLNQRYFYTDKDGVKKCKVSGVCKSMLLFKETCLMTHPDIDMDDVEPVENRLESHVESEPVSEEIDFVDAMHFGYKRPSMETTQVSKKMKMDEMEAIPCIPENVEKDRHIPILNDFVTTRQSMKF